MSTQSSRPRRSAVAGDRIYRTTKWLAALVIPFLVVAFVLLFFWPANTDTTFAWPIRPPMTAMMLASAYIGGVYYFSGVLLARRWHHIKAGILPVTAFASLLGIATFLHWDRFTHSHVSFFAWTGLYVTTPFLVFATWFWNRREDPGTPDPDDKHIARPLRLGLGAVGVIAILISVLLFLQPQWMIGVWPWTLTPLTARVMGAMFALPGLVGLGIATDARWSSARLILQAQAFSILFILISAGRAWANFDPTNPATLIFVGGLVLLLLALGGFYAAMSRRAGG